jgi:predicted GNAT superfamily acetyltransferase
MDGKAYEREKMISIRRLMPEDSIQVLSLNATAQPHVALLDSAELERLQALSQAHLVAEEAQVILGYALTFSRDDAYDGEEFVTLRTLIPQSFIYIDQIVILDSAKRAGIGRRLYGALEHAALLRGAHRLCCEVNITPPNPDSLAFHDRLDFIPVGSLATRDGRNVRLLQKRLRAGPG